MDEDSQNLLERESGNVDINFYDDDFNIKYLPSWIFTFENHIVQELYCIKNITNYIFLFTLCAYSEITNKDYIEKWKDKIQYIHIYITVLNVAILSKTFIFFKNIKHH